MLKFMALGLNVGIFKGYEYFLKVLYTLEKVHMLCVPDIYVNMKVGYMKQINLLVESFNNRRKLYSQQLI